MHTSNIRSFRFINMIKIRSKRDGEEGKKIKGHFTDI